MLHSRYIDFSLSYPECIVIIDCFHISVHLNTGIIFYHTKFNINLCDFFCNDLLNIYFCRTLSTFYPERWESGLIHQFAKLAYSYRVPGVRIPPSPQHNKNHAISVVFYLEQTESSLLAFGM